MHKFRITEVGKEVTIEVLKGNDVILIKKFPVDLDFKLDDIREQLRFDVQLQEVKKKEEERLKSKEDDLKLKLNKKFDL